MAKKRVYEIARELDLESREVLERALELGFE
ncbi:MAG: translation initiation factor IF-2 N-terminal domain-containing protein, partial [Acidimicrobiia bacterium]